MNLISASRSSPLHCGRLQVALCWFAQAAACLVVKLLNFLQGQVVAAMWAIIQQMAITKCVRTVHPATPKPPSVQQAAHKQSYKVCSVLSCWFGQVMQCSAVGTVLSWSVANTFILDVPKAVCLNLTAVPLAPLPLYLPRFTFLSVLLHFALPWRKVDKMKA